MKKIQLCSFSRVQNLSQWCFIPVDCPLRMLVARLLELLLILLLLLLLLHQVCRVESVLRLHLFFLLQWLRTLPSSRQSFNVVFGECPYCSKVGTGGHIKVTQRWQRPLLHLLCPPAAHHSENGSVGDESRREASSRTRASRRAMAKHSSAGLLEVLQEGVTSLSQLQSIQSRRALWNLIIGCV